MKHVIKPLLFITIFVLVGFFSAEYASAQQTYFLDPTFDPGTGFNNQAFNGEVQPDSKLVLPGVFTTYNGVTTNRIARINTDGTLDTTFTTNTGTGFNNITYGVTVQPDGKLIVVGIFSQFNGVAHNSIVRLNADGTLDTSFNANLPGVLTLYHTSVQSDGKIIVTGNFTTTISGTTYSRLMRFNADGTIDTSFVPTFTGGSLAFSRIQPDGKIIVTGNILSANGTTLTRIARLNTDGSTDTAFATNTGTGFNASPARTAILSNGKIIVTGGFTLYNGISANRIVRLNADGTLDTTFNIGTGLNSGGTSFLFVQPNGKIIVTGGFTSYNGVNRNGVVRLNSDGTLDNSFDTASGVTGGVANADILSQGVMGNEKFYIAGTFTAYDGVSRNRVARIKYVDTTAPVITNVTISSNNTVPTYATTGNIITLSFSTDDVLTGSSVTLGGQTVTPVCNDTGLATIPCTADITVTSAIPLVDGNVKFSLSLTSAGGTTGSITTTSNGSAVNVERLTASSTGLYGPSGSNIALGGMINTTTNSNTAIPTPLPTTGTGSTYISPVDGTTKQCRPFTTYLKLGKKNDTDEVKLWQAFLNKHMGEKLTVSGIYNKTTESAIKRFQSKYTTEILTPWGLTKPTGYTYKSTRAQGNKILGCSEGEVKLDNGVVIK